MDRLHCTVVTVMVLIPRVAAGCRRMAGWAGLTALMKKGDYRRDGESDQ